MTEKQKKARKSMVDLEELENLTGSKPGDNYPLD